MSLPKQYSDKDLRASGFFALGNAYTCTDELLSAEAGDVLDEDAATAILVYSATGCTFEIGASPTGSGTNLVHTSPAGFIFPVIIPENQDIFINGTAIISVVA